MDLKRSFRNLHMHELDNRCKRSASLYWPACACRVPYIISLLQKGLAISEDRIRIGNGKEGWTLGAALAEGGRVGIGRPLLDKVLEIFAQCGGFCRQGITV